MAAITAAASSGEAVLPCSRRRARRFIAPSLSRSRACPPAPLSTGLWPSCCPALRAGRPRRPGRQVDDRRDDPARAGRRLRRARRRRRARIHGAPPSVGAPRRAARASGRSLLFFGQLTDPQIADEMSPARVDFLDPAGGELSSSWRPQEALGLQVFDQIVRNVNANRRSEVARATGKRAQARLRASPPATSPTTSSSTRRAGSRRVLDGGPRRPVLRQAGQRDEPVRRAAGDGRRAQRRRRRAAATPASPTTTTTAARRPTATPASGTRTRRAPARRPVRGVPALPRPARARAEPVHAPRA